MFHCRLPRTCCLLLLQEAVHQGRAFVLSIQRRLGRAVQKGQHPVGQVVLQRRQGEPQEAPLQQAQRALLVELRKLAQPVRQPAAGGTFQLVGCLGKTGREAGGACEAVGGARAAPRPAALASPPVQVVHLCRVDIQEFVALQAPQGVLQLLIEAVVARLRALAAIQCWRPG